MLHAMITKIGGTKKVIHLGILLDMPEQGQPLRLFLDNGHFTTTPLKRVFHFNDNMYVESENSRYKVETKEMSDEDQDEISIDVDLDMA